MAGRFHRNNQSGKLTVKDKDKLIMGTKDQKKQFNRYGLNINRDILNMKVPKTPKVKRLRPNSKNNTMDLRRSYYEQVERDIRASTVSSHGSDENSRRTEERMAFIKSNNKNAMMNFDHHAEKEEEDDDDTESNLIADADEENLGSDDRTS